MTKRQALFRFDAGLLFVAAGLALCAAVVLMPAQRDLFMLQQQRDELHRQDEQMHTRLRVTEEVLLELDRGNPDLHRRLVSSQLNLAPASDTPIMLVTSQQPDVNEWISARVRNAPAAISSQAAWPDSMLDRLVNGPYRLWILGGSVLCVFIGLMHGTGTIRRRDHTNNDSVNPSIHISIDADETITLTDATEHADDDRDSCREADDRVWCEIRTIPKHHAGETVRNAPGKDADPLRFPKSLFDTTD